MATSASAGLHAYPARERDRFLAQMARAPEQYREFVEQYTSRTVSRLSWGSPHPSSVLRETTFGLLQSISPAGALPNAVTWLALLPRDFFICRPSSLLARGGSLGLSLCVKCRTGDLLGNHGPLRLCGPRHCVRW